MGSPPTMVAKMRTNIVRAARPEDSGGCAATTVAITLGVRSDPLVKSRVELVEAWFELWDAACARDEQEAVRHTWRQCQSRLLLGTAAAQRWRQVYGPMAAVQAALSDAGWSPCAPDVWRDQRGKEWAVQCGDKNHSLVDALVGDLEAQLWRKAGLHEDGRGMEDGVDLDASLVLLRRLAKAGGQYRGMLEAILTGAMRTNERKERCMHHAGIYPVCTRCGAGVPDTLMHQ